MEDQVKSKTEILLASQAQHSKQQELPFAPWDNIVRFEKSNLFLFNSINLILGKVLQKIY